MSDIEIINAALATARSVAFVVEFDDADLAWFRKPLTEES